MYLDTGIVLADRGGAQVDQSDCAGTDQDDLVFQLPGVDPARQQVDPNIDGIFDKVISAWRSI